MLCVQTLFLFGICIADRVFGSDEKNSRIGGGGNDKSFKKFLLVNERLRLFCYCGGFARVVETNDNAIVFEELGPGSTSRVKDRNADLRA